MGLFAYPHVNSVAVLSSLSADGSLQARILARLGFVVCRGSSSRGGAAGLKSIVSELRHGGCDAAFAVDGPRGPYREAKPGAIDAAKLAGAIILPIHAHANSVWVFRKSWDQYTLPKPFAKVTICVGEPMAPENVTAVRLTESINNLGTQLQY
ncbi:MAG: DUF374 domain-containing protein [Deltaproteobacteria bacterium]|nr:DUF374 domain-containing protein [Deltaproteobacteria bacterium]MBN2670031.1 DUF374 domain-containing protein [Deltaproteobacteria bacterium]